MTSCEVSKVYKPVFERIFLLDLNSAVGSRIRGLRMPISNNGVSVLNSLGYKRCTGENDV